MAGSATGAGAVGGGVVTGAMGMDEKNWGRL